MMGKNYLSFKKLCVVISICKASNTVIKQQRTYQEKTLATKYDKELLVNKMLKVIRKPLSPE